MKRLLVKLYLLISTKLYICPPDTSEGGHLLVIIMIHVHSSSYCCMVLREPQSRHGFDGVSQGLGTQLTHYQFDRFLAANYIRTRLAHDC